MDIACFSYDKNRFVNTEFLEGKIVLLRLCATAQEVYFSFDLSGFKIH